MFIDANHEHPWPTLDLLAVLGSLSASAGVILHDINLPLLHSAFPAWDVKYLFDDLRIVKDVPQDAAIPNIGSITVPADKAQLRAQLASIFKYDWHADVPEGYLRKLGVNRLEQSLEGMA